MATQNWKIYWNEYSSDTYLYGSEVSYHARNDVEYKNELMPAGTVIKQWYSKTNYEEQKIEPSLPIIDGESRYKLIVDIETDEKESYLFRLVFLDRFEQEAGFINVTQKETIFRCPLKTYSYKLQLINGGLKHFHFHHVELWDISDEPETDSAQAGEDTRKSKKKRK